MCWSEMRECERVVVFMCNGCAMGCKTRMMVRRFATRMRMMMKMRIIVQVLHHDRWFNNKNKIATANTNVKKNTIEVTRI